MIYIHENVFGYKSTLHIDLFRLVDLLDQDWYFVIVGVFTIGKLDMLRYGKYKFILVDEKYVPCQDYIPVLLHYSNGNRKFMYSVWFMVSPHFLPLIHPRS